MSVIKPGMAVVFNAGGPYMSVDEIRDDGGVVCVWFDAQYHAQTGVFWQNALLPAYDDGGFLRPNYAPAKAMSDKCVIPEDD